MKKIISESGFSGKKAQLSMEFVVFIAVSMLIMVSFLYIIGERESQIKEKRQNLLAKDLAYKIQLEFDTASIVENGYCRKFSIPPTLEGLIYNANISNGLLYLNSSDKFDVSTRIPNVTGNINIGDNIIRKKEGNISINIPINTPCP